MDAHIRMPTSAEIHPSHYGKNDKNVLKLYRTLSTYTL